MRRCFFIKIVCFLLFSTEVFAGNANGNDCVAIQIKVVDDCSSANVVGTVFDGMRFYRGRLTLDTLNDDLEIKDVQKGVVTFNKDDSKWVTVYIPNVSERSFSSFFSGAVAVGQKQTEIILFDDNVDKIVDVNGFLLNNSSVKVVSFKSLTKDFAGTLSLTECFAKKATNLKYINLENMCQHDIWYKSSAFMFSDCDNLVAIFINENVDDLMFCKAPKDTYFCCYKGCKDKIVKNVGEKYKDRIIEINNQENVLNFFIANKDILKGELKKMFEDKFVNGKEDVDGKEDIKVEHVDIEKDSNKEIK